MRWTSTIALLLAVPVSAAAQAPDAPRTPWGTPDLSGYWEYRSTTPLQRPEELAGRAVLTPAEEAEYLTERHAAIGRERDLQLNADWWQPGGLTDGRTSLIVDPPDGRLPARTPAGAERARTLGIAIRLRSADGPEDRERYERCIMGRTVPLLAVLAEPAGADLPDPGLRRHPARAELRPAGHSARRPAAARRADPPVAGQLPGPVGGRHAGCRDRGLQRRVDDPGQRARRALRRAHPVRRRRHAPLRVHGRRPRLVRRFLDGDVPHRARRRTGVRERLPRGQLQHAADPARRARRRTRAAVTSPAIGLYGSVDRVGQLAIVLGVRAVFPQR